MFSLPPTNSCLWPLCRYQFAVMNTCMHKTQMKFYTHDRHSVLTKPLGFILIRPCHSTENFDKGHWNLSEYGYLGNDYCLVTDVHLRRLCLADIARLSSVRCAQLWQERALATMLNCDSATFYCRVARLVILSIQTVAEHSCFGSGTPALSGYCLTVRVSCLWIHFLALCMCHGYSIIFSFLIHVHCARVEKVVCGQWTCV